MQGWVNGFTTICFWFWNQDEGDKIGAEITELGWGGDQTSPPPHPTDKDPEGATVKGLIESNQARAKFIKPIIDVDFTNVCWLVFLLKCGKVKYDWIVQSISVHTYLPIIKST